MSQSTDNGEQHSPTLALAIDLIARESVTPEDGGCQALIGDRLSALGFELSHLPRSGVSNLWARHGNAEPLFVFAGHTDVVPPGPLDEWHSAPFEPSLRNGQLYGRGAADMKGGLAAMVTATERFLARHPQHQGSIAFLLTSDEEGPAIDGTCCVLEHLQEQDVAIDWCVLGEPTSEVRVGDTLKPGRRGSLNGTLKIHGIQGHIAYPQLADNPIFLSLPALAELRQEVWDQGNDHFPPTSFQISNLHAGAGAVNIIPGVLELQFNFRYSTELSEQILRQRVEAILDRHELSYDLKWQHSGAPFLTSDGMLLEATQAVVTKVTGVAPTLSTSGGTSDGRFIRPAGAEVVELGPVNSSIHKLNECVGVAELESLSQIYEGILERLLTK